MCSHVFCTALTPDGLAELEWLKQFVWSATFSPSWQHSKLNQKLHSASPPSTPAACPLPESSCALTYWEDGHHLIPALLRCWPRAHHSARCQIPITERAPLRTALANCIAKASWHITWHCCPQIPPLHSSLEPHRASTWHQFCLSMLRCSSVPPEISKLEMTLLWVFWRPSNGYLTPQKFCHKRKIKGCTHTHIHTELWGYQRQFF